jgi:orotate phosphoribosyltransferase
MVFVFIYFDNLVPNLIHLIYISLILLNMVTDKNIAQTIAQHLLEIKAVKLQPQQPFTWASGWKSPIYCDNRKTLSYPAIRNFVKESFAKIIQAQFKGVEIIAGVATAGIPHAALIADALQLPMIYVRSEAKKHGLTNMIEGNLEANKKVVVIEDLISTGGSSLKCVSALKEAGAEVLGLAAIFSYGFETAVEQFRAANCHYVTLSDYNHLIETALEMNYVKTEDLDTLKQWRMNPSVWNT